MEHLYTRSGRLLQLSGDHLHSRSGSYLGQVRDGKVFGPDDRYCGTIVGDRVVYRTIDSAARVAASAAPACAATTSGNHPGKSLWGQEPTFAD